MIFSRAAAVDAREAAEDRYLPDPMRIRCHIPINFDDE
jgi:hypothetical protein